MRHDPGQQPAHPTGGGVDQDGVTGAHRVGVVRQVVRGQALQDRRGRLFGADPLRYGHQPVRRDDRLLGVAARHAGPRDPVAGGEALDPVAEPQHRAGALAAERERQLDLVGAGALIDVHEVDAARLDQHQHLTGPGSGSGTSLTFSTDWSPYSSNTTARIRYSLLRRVGFLSTPIRRSEMSYRCRTIPGSLEVSTWGRPIVSRSIWAPATPSRSSAAATSAPRALLFDGIPVHGRPASTPTRPAGSPSAATPSGLAQLAPSRFEPYPKRSVDEGAVLLGDREVTVVEMLAASCAAGRRRVAAGRGPDPVGTTVLTCPADWGGQRRRAVLLEAARAASLGPVVLRRRAGRRRHLLHARPRPAGRPAAVPRRVRLRRRHPRRAVVRREAAPDGLRGPRRRRPRRPRRRRHRRGARRPPRPADRRADPEIWQRLANPAATAAHRDRRRSGTRCAPPRRCCPAPPPPRSTCPASKRRRTSPARSWSGSPARSSTAPSTRPAASCSAPASTSASSTRILLVGGSSRHPAGGEPAARPVRRRAGRAGAAGAAGRLWRHARHRHPAAAALRRRASAAAHARSPAPRSSPGHSPAFPPYTAFPVSVRFPGLGHGGHADLAGRLWVTGRASRRRSTCSRRRRRRPRRRPRARSARGRPRPGSGPARTGPPLRRTARGAAARPCPARRPGRHRRSRAVPAVAGGFGAGFPPGGQAGVHPAAGDRRPRRRTAPWIALIIVLALIGGCLWGGTKIFGWIGAQFEAAKDGFPGVSPTGDGRQAHQPEGRRAQTRANRSRSTRRGGSPRSPAPV